MPKAIDEASRVEKIGQTLLSDIPVECPASLLNRAAQCATMRVAVVNATTPLALESVREAYERGLIEPILIGASKDVQAAADEIDWDIASFRLECASGEQQAATVAVELAANSEVNAIMKGKIATDVLMRAAIDRHAGLRTDKLMSHVFHMTVPGNDKALFITDAVLNILPTVKQKAQIVKNVMSLLLAIGYSKPKVALLSASETESAAMPSTVDAAELVRQATNGDFPGATIDGPLAFDLAVSKKAAAIKGFESAVAGNADVVVVPNIETGNALFKMMVHFMSAAAAGIVLGAKVPIILTSRSDPTAARLASIALATIYADTI